MTQAQRDQLEIQRGAFTYALQNARRQQAAGDDWAADLVKEYEGELFDIEQRLRDTEVSV